MYPVEKTEGAYSSEHVKKGNVRMRVTRMYNR